MSVSGSAIRSLSASAKKPAGGSCPRRLSARQLQILQLTANGMSSDAIAEQLSVSEETVRTHMRRTSAKLEAHNRAHAVAIGLRAGMIS